MCQKENCHKGLVGKQSAKRTAFDSFLCYILLYINVPSASEYYIPINNEKTDKLEQCFRQVANCPILLKNIKPNNSMG